MLILAIDTTDARGGIALLDEERVLETLAHAPGDEYSAWLIPAVASVLAAARLSHEDIEAYAAAAGPGSFTGVRVGLTTLKAWGEVFGKVVVGVSRLEAMAYSKSGSDELVAPFFDAQRGQVFGGLYRRRAGEIVPVAEDIVAPPAEFLAWISDRSMGKKVEWVSLDGPLLCGLEGWKIREAAGETMNSARNVAVNVGLLGLHKIAQGQGVSPLGLDANYVRRSDAEIFAKKPAAT